MSPSTSPWIKDVTDETFEQEVLEASRTRPVVVDFWNEYCQPCMMLKPILEAAATQRDGGFLLAKCNTNETPMRAREFDVQGIPAVFAVVNGEVVDQFTGLQPPQVIDGWLDGLGMLQSLHEAEQLESSDPEAAEALYRKLLDEREDLAEARIGMARALINMKEEDAARDEIAKLQRRGYLEPEAERILAQLNLGEKKDVDLDGLASAADQNPDDLNAQVALGEAFAGQGQHERAMETLIGVIEKQKDGPGEEARQKLLEIFKVAGNDSDLTREYRRRLSALLF